MDYIKPLLGEDNLITAWDVHFERTDIDNKLDNSYAIIGMESIMDVPFDKKYMVPGNIIMTKSGKVIGNRLTADQCINLFRGLYGKKSTL